MPLRGITVAIILVAIVLVIGLILLGFMSDFLVDLLWFSATGYLDVFWTMFRAKAVVSLTAFTVSTAMLWANGWLALQFSGRPWRSLHVVPWQSVPGRTLPELLEPFRGHSAWHLVIAAAAAVIGILVATAEIANWDVILRFLYQAPFAQTDPLFGMHIGFYMFSLPAYVAIRNWMQATLILSFVLAGIVYWLRGDIDFDGRRRSMSPAAIAHGSVLLGLFFAIKAWSYVLDRYLLLYGDNGVVVGAGYTDIHVELPVLWVLVGLAIAAAFLALVNQRFRTYRLPAAATLLVFGSSFVLSELTPGMFQRLFVKPNELELERPYIKRNIVATQQAYNLHHVVVKTFPAEQDLTFANLEANRATVDNIRLWDWQPLMDTYRQMQEIRTYYKFHDVDVDRYWLEGAYQAVMLSARELKATLLPPNAQTWVNRHVLFTHGNGVVMSPVTRTTAEGLPDFYLQNIPPVATGGPAVQQPRIYYGEETDDYVVVKGSTPEFDYPNGKDNVYGNYEGSGGVAVGSVARRVLFAWYFEDLNLLLSRYLTGDSRIMLRRNIKERIEAIAPFLTLDHDPYVVVSDGRLFWIQDAYTTSDYFPYAQRLPNQDLNYIRNAVKVVVDAYNGTVELYLVDPADPVAATYQRIFPSLFRPLSAMPPDLQKHIRYPEDLFRIQAQMYRAYHMDSPDVFYNREDLWQFPRQPGGETATMVPYYIILRLPGESQAEFFLMLPMVPSQRQNMIAWLAARCDSPHYGELIVYEFPKDKLVFGPFQIEALINQNTEISQQLSLWNQLGSRVIRGHLIVIPIDNSILYVSPLYLRAETGQLPELKRVIAAYGDRVVMEDSLQDALSALFKETPASLPPSAVPMKTTPAPVEADRARDALNHYNSALEQLKNGNWSAFGVELDKLRAALEALQ